MLDYMLYLTTGNILCHIISYMYILCGGTDALKVTMMRLKALKSNYKVAIKLKNL